MDFITYTLRDCEADGGPFYPRLSEFTDGVIGAAGRFLADIPTGYREWLAVQSREPLRTDGEYLFDFLTLGTLDRLYGGRARTAAPAVCRLLSLLYESRRRFRPAKPAIDAIRGVLATAYLADGRTGASNGRERVPGDTIRLIRWLEATGEYREEVNRLQRIAEWLQSLPGPRGNDILMVLHDFAGWFEDAAVQAFGSRTASVGRFLHEEYTRHRWREDVMFCGRREVEYHLGMLSAEIMNRAYRADFLATSRKAVLLPACMRGRSACDCRARRVSLDMICTGCSPECVINRYTRLGREWGFTVHIVPHSSDFTSWLKTWAVGRDIGVVGVACLLNLVTGGLELKSLDIPAQCIPLDYCGCANHWHATGISTALSEREMFRILEITAPTCA